jgi:NAD(P)-dependent dehydrogenase (short-subunit alcohol dehydrogenase family)
MTENGFRQFDMSGKTALITGASRGIGAATARAFAAQGANVVLMARDRDAIAGLAGEIGAKALAVPVDVSRYWEVEAAVTAAVDSVRHGRHPDQQRRRHRTRGPDGGRRPRGLGPGDRHQPQGRLPRHARRAAGNAGKGGGSIITISSGAAHNPLEGGAITCASKAAVAMLTRCLHLEHGASGIRAMGLSPGTVATQMQKEIKASGVNPVSQLDWSDHIPPEWPAVALSWMCSAESDAHLGEEISLRSPEIRATLGLTA